MTRSAAYITDVIAGVWPTYQVKLNVEDEMSVTLSRRLFTAEEFRRMDEAGLLREDDRLELVEGVIVEMGPNTDNTRSTVVDTSKP